MRYRLSILITICTVLRSAEAQAITDENAENSFEGGGRQDTDMNESTALLPTEDTTAVHSKEVELANCLSQNDGDEETDLDGSIFSSMTPVFDLAVSQTSSHSVFGDGSGLHIVGDVDSGADSSCNEGNQACTTEDAIIDLANGPTVNDEKDMSESIQIPLTNGSESLMPKVMSTLKPTLQSSSREPDSQQNNIFLTKANKKSKKTKSKKTPTSKSQNPKATMAVCHIPTDDPRACRNMLIRTSALGDHLAHGDLQGTCDTVCDSFCDRVGTCSSKNLNKCICCDCEQECFTGTRVECQVGKINICRYNPDLNTYETVCMAEASVSSYLEANSSDYYGKCEADIFIKNSVSLSVPPAQGTEELDQYTVDYDVSFNEDGIVVLSKSVDIIDGVLCSSHQVDIFFSKPLAPISLSSMFPKWAILVVDGNLFGTKCDLSPIEGGREQPSNLSFMVIETSRVIGSIVTVSGVPTVLDSIFEKQDMHYQMTSQGDQTRRLATFEGEVKLPPELPPNVVPLQFVAKTKTTVTASADFDFHTEMVRMETIFSLGIYYPKIEITALVDYHCNIKIKNSFKFSKGHLKCPGSEACPNLEWDILPDIPIAAVPVPTFILRWLKVSFTTRLGLMLTFPLTFQFKLESSLNQNINLGEGNIDVGEKRIRLGIRHFPLLGILGTEPMWEVLKDEKAKFVPDEVPDQDPDPNVAENAILKFEMRFGLSPQVRLDSFSLAWVSVGTFIGIESTSTLKLPPYGQTLGRGCDKCHFMRSDVGFVLRDVFLRYRKYKEEVKTNVLIAFYQKIIIFKLCLIGLNNAIACGDRCCLFGHKCVADVCQAPGLCPYSCCSDKDCEHPSVCSLSKNQCQCPYECCGDSDCTIVGEFCDGVTHQCTNESHDIHKQPYKIVQIGDAFSSGTGAMGYIEPQSCFRSGVNWGRIFAKTRADHLAVQYINRASDGAVMKDYYENKYLGQQALPPEGCPASMGDELIVKDGIVCKRFVRAQQSAITSDVELVLMTFGGKHFRRIVLLCCVTGFVQPQGCKTTLAEAHNYAASQLKGDLVNILLDVATRMKPGGNVLFSSYPHLIADVEYIIGNTGGDRFDARTAVRDLAAVIDQQQQDAINEANAIAVGRGGSAFALFFGRTKDVFAGHEPKPGILEDSENLWINDSSPVYLSEEWYHPNAIGHKKWAEAIANYVNGQIDGGGSSTNTGANNIDLVFVIDATLSMSEEIADVRIAMADLTNLIANTSNSYRIAIVTYRDIEAVSGYPSKLNLDFTNDLIKIQAAIDGIELGDGGSTWPETTLSGLNTALGLQYRSGVTKMIIAVGDEPPLLEDGKEPVTGLTVEYIVKKCIELDPVQVMAVNVGVDGHMDNTAMNEITDGTSGSIIELGTGGVVQAIKTILEDVSRQPFAWFGDNIVATIGESLLFDASGSFDPFGLPITSYEWDFNGDNNFDETTTEPTIDYVYHQPFDGYVVLRVKSAAGAGVATAHVIINGAGSVPQLGPEHCEIDTVSGLPILEDADGKQLYCIADSNMWPIANKPGVFVIVKDNKPIIRSCMEVLSLPRIINLQPCDARNKMRITKRQVEIGDYTSACSTLHDMITLIGDTGDACVEMCRTMNPTPSPTSKPRKRQSKPFTKPKIKPTKRLK